MNRSSTYASTPAYRAAFEIPGSWPIALRGTRKVRTASASLLPLRSNGLRVPHRWRNMLKH
jgi:hypothetical protein